MSNGERQLNPEQLLVQIQNAILLRSAQDQVLWTMFSLFWATNAILIVALFNTGSLPKELWITGAISTTGSLMALVWHWVQARALGNVMKHELLMQRLENSSIIPETKRTSRSPEDVYNRLLGADAPWYLRGPRARNLLPWCSLTLATVWAVIAIISWVSIVL